MVLFLLASSLLAADAPKPTIWVSRVLKDDRSVPPSVRIIIAYRFSTTAAPWVEIIPTPFLPEAGEDVDLPPYDLLLRTKQDSDRLAKTREACEIMWQDAGYCDSIVEALSLSDVPTVSTPLCMLSFVRSVSGSNGIFTFKTPFMPNALTSVETTAGIIGPDPYAQIMLEWEVVPQNGLVPMQVHVIDPSGALDLTEIIVFPRGKATPFIVSVTQSPTTPGKWHVDLSFEDMSGGILSRPCYTAFAALFE